MNVERLRAETRTEHEAVEALVPLTSSGLTLELYAETLRRMHPVVHGWEAWAAAHSPVQYRGMLSERQRSHLIEQDLASLREALAMQADLSVERRLTAGLLQDDGSRMASPANFLGAMYVMEGSTLGGQYIARHVEEKFGFAPGDGDAYFRGYAERTSAMWQSFKEHLIALPDADHDTVVAAAKFMFRTFGDAMQQSSAAVPA